MRELKKLIQVSSNKAQGLTYAAVTKSNMPILDAANDKANELKQQQRLRVEDEKCSITVKNLRVKDGESDFVAVDIKYEQATKDSELWKSTVYLSPPASGRIDIRGLRSCGGRQKSSESSWVVRDCDA